MSAEKRVHALTLSGFNILCGQGGPNIRTSIVKDAKDKSFWRIVTCKRCLMYRKAAYYGG